MITAVPDIILISNIYDISDISDMSITTINIIPMIRFFQLGRVEGRCQFLRISFEYMSNSHEGECYIHTPLEQVLEESFHYSIKLMEEKFKKKKKGMVRRMFSKK